MPCSPAERRPAKKPRTARDLPPPPPPPLRCVCTPWQAFGEDSRVVGEAPRSVRSAPTRCRRVCPSCCVCRWARLRGLALGLGVDDPDTHPSARQPLLPSLHESAPLFFVPRSSIRRSGTPSGRTYAMARLLLLLLLPHISGTELGGCFSAPFLRPPPPPPPARPPKQTV